MFSGEQELFPAGTYSNPPTLTLAGHWRKERALWFDAVCASSLTAVSRSAETATVARNLIHGSRREGSNGFTAK